jgi:hypothetical protein
VGPARFNTPALYTALGVYPIWSGKLDCDIVIEVLVAVADALKVYDVPLIANMVVPAGIPVPDTVIPAYGVPTTDDAVRVAEPLVVGLLMLATSNSKNIGILPRAFLASSFRRNSSRKIIDG